MLARHLLSESEFWGSLPLPTVPFSDPVGAEDSYWRGRIWPPMNYWVWEGLRRAGRGDIATELARRSWEMYDREWSTKRHSHENFNREDPARHEAHDSDPFYSWGALIPFMWEAERADVSPWDGLCLGDRTGGEEATIILRGRTYTVRTNEDRMGVLVDGEEVFAVSPPARVSQIALATNTTEFHLDGAPRAVELPRRPAHVTVDGQPRTVDACADGSVRIPATRGRVQVQFDNSDKNEVT
jgi:putative isomerase